MDVKANLYPCAHCEGTGTCTSAADGYSCTACVKTNELKGRDHVGLACGTCQGLGQAEPKTERLNKRVQPILSLMVVYALLFMIFISALMENKYFSEILAFSAPLIGMVLTSYSYSRRTQTYKQN